MLCDKCQPIIAQAGETKIEQKVQIKYLISCQGCSEKIIDRCHTCCWPIYKFEPIYESSRSIPSKDIVIIRLLRHFIFKLKEENSEKVIQCDFCYCSWKNELKERKEKLKGKKSNLDDYSAFLFLSALTLVYPEWIKRILDEFECFKKCNHPYTYIAGCGLFIFGFSIFRVNKIIKETPKVDRYKDRKRVKEK